MKLTYWVSANTSELHGQYDIRRKTKKAVVAHVKRYCNVENYTAPRKVTVEYGNALDLLNQCSEEGSHGWECDFSSTVHMMDGVERDRFSMNAIDREGKRI